MSDTCRQAVALFECRLRPRHEVHQTLNFWIATQQLIHSDPLPDPSGASVVFAPQTLQSAGSARRNRAYPMRPFFKSLGANRDWDCPHEEHFPFGGKPRVDLAVITHLQKPVHGMAAAATRRSLRRPAGARISDVHARRYAGSPFTRLVMNAGPPQPALPKRTSRGGKTTAVGCPRSAILISWPSMNSSQMTGCLYSGAERPPVAAPSAH